MKRPRSYGDDLDGAAAAAEKASFKDWERSSSHHRRYHPKLESIRKGSNSASSSHDRDYDRAARKRFDHDHDASDRRRYRDASSPRSGSHSGGGDRAMHRSESFSALRREFPKGFRSERDRSRREVSSGSSWRRPDEMRSPSISSDRGKGRERDSSGGEQSKRAESTKAEKSRKESCCSSSEMEEGELEPDPEPVPEAKSPSPAEPLPPSLPSARENCEVEEIDGCKEIMSSEAKSKEAVSSEMPVDQVRQEEKVSDDSHDAPAKEMKSAVNGEQAEAAIAGNEPEISPVECTHLDLPSRRAEPEPLPEQPASKEEKGCVVSVEVEASKGEEMDINLGVKKNEAKGTECIELQSLSMEVEVESTSDGDDMKLVSATEQMKGNDRDKGKSLAITLSGNADSTADDNAMEGTRGRGFELVFRSDTEPTKQESGDGLVLTKQLVEKPKLEPLDLCLALPGASLDRNLKPLKPDHSSPRHATSVQSLPSSFRTISDGFTTSISFSGSQQFTHNPSCSLTQNSVENYEQSVGSHPIFQGVDQVSNGTIWQAQTSNEPKRKGGCGALFQRVLLNGNATSNSLKPDVLSRQLSLPRQLSPANSDTRSENSKDKRFLTRVRSSSSLFRKEQRDGEHVVLNAAGVVDRIISKIVSEPLQLTGRMLHEMTEQSVAYLRESLCEMVANADRSGQVHSLREALQRRSDLTMETMTKCPRFLLEILVTLKTGIPDFLRRTDNIPTPDLVEIFMDLKCRNPICRTSLPVDDCDCGVCVQKNGFCRECMCLSCSKFDMASNTCSWVGCDVCLHWCHTDCGLRESHIRNGRSSGTEEMTEMQFHCLACHHPSEMFGFVKEVFKTCAKQWKSETLAKELEYVRRIFAASNDSRGKKLCDVAKQMVLKLEDKANHSEVINYVMSFLSESESNTGAGTSTLPPTELTRKNVERIACSSKAATWFPSVSSDKVSGKKNIDVYSSMDYGRISRQTRDDDLHINMKKKPVDDELESVVKFKQAEAKMYQERADEARREAEGLKRIAVAKNDKVEEEYASRILKLRLGEAEERRRQKLEELQVIERAHHEYFNMKTRMEADINDLLLKMEAIKRNFST